MKDSNRLSTMGSHRGPHLGVLAIVFTVLFNAGLYFVISFSPNAPHFPGPWESAETIAAYFQTQPRAVLMCAFLQFGSAIPLGLFTATIVSRLQFPRRKSRGRLHCTFRRVPNCF
jgi:ABC-type Fe3+ transport system permease subunit